MPCGIRWKVFGLLALMAALPVPLYFAGKDAVEKYATDRELVDALNDAQLAANAIQEQLDRVDRKLTRLAMTNDLTHLVKTDEPNPDPSALGELDKRLDALNLQLEEIKKESDYGDFPRHQPGVIFNHLATCSRSQIASRIADASGHPELNKASKPEWTQRFEHRTKTQRIEVGTSFWWGLQADQESDQVTCWAVFPLSDAEPSNSDSYVYFIVAQINLTPTFENARYPRNFLTVLDCDGRRVFRPAPVKELVAPHGSFPGWNDFTKNDRNKAARLRGQRYGGYLDVDEAENPTEGFNLRSIAGIDYAYYRQSKIQFHQNAEGAADDFRDFIDRKMNDFRSISSRGIKRVAFIKFGETSGELRIRGASRDEIGKIQSESLTEWESTHPGTIKEVTRSYQSEMREVALCMTGVNFPAETPNDDGGVVGNPDFTLANAISIQEIKRAAVSQLEGPARALFIGTLIICVLGVAFAWYVTQPLMLMTRAAQELASRVSTDTEGDCEELRATGTSLPVTRNDEVGALARAFAEMRDKVIASNGELNERVRTRTSELETSKQKLEEYVETLRRTSHELQEQRDRAKVADKAKTGFLATVSHEMKTPLHWLNGYARRLRRTELDERQERCVEKIFEGIDQLTHLIGDVLDYQKMLLGGMSVELETTNPKSICESLVETMEGRAEERGNSISLNVQCDVDQFVTDPHRLNQILSNLITNACKFTQDGRIHLSLSLDEESDGFPEQLIFEVSDTGVGIPPDHLKNLFTPFEKRKAKQGNNDGTGLGLVICKELARLLGGDVTVQSEVDVGTTFTVSLPTGLSVDEAEKGAERRAEPADFDASRVFQGDSQNRPVVLTIDDDHRSTELLTQELEAANCRVINACSGETGIDRATMLQPDLIALDIVMPGMDGWEVLERLKADERTMDIPVILVTIVGDTRRGLALGADGYITKPFDPRELRRVIRRVLGSHPGSVLIVDDDANSREIVRDALDETGFSVSEAADGEEALEQIVDCVPDAILLDLNMPRMDGFGLVEQLRARGLLAETRIIVVSGRELSVDERARLSDAVMSFFDKAAMDEQQLKSEIRRLLKKTLPAATASSN